MLTILLLAALTAGADTTVRTWAPDSLSYLEYTVNANGDTVGGMSVTRRFEAGWKTTQPFEGISTPITPAYPPPDAVPDSLCATCGKVCVFQAVPCPSYGGIQTLQICYATLCPDHGRHVEWLGSAVVAKWGKRVPMPFDGDYSPAPPDSVWDVRVEGPVEIGLREDGTVVWRKVVPR